MPYINEDAREQLTWRTPANVGELTYEITQTVMQYLDEKGASFARFGEAIAALEAAKLELYRRVVAPYEDGKCEANGDVYEVDEEAA